MQAKTDTTTTSGGGAARFSSVLPPDPGAGHGPQHQADHHHRACPGSSGDSLAGRSCVAPTSRKDPSDRVCVGAGARDSSPWTTTVGVGRDRGAYRSGGSALAPLLDLEFVPLRANQDTSKRAARGSLEGDQLSSRAAYNRTLRGSGSQGKRLRRKHPIMLAQRRRLRVARMLRAVLAVTRSHRTR